MSAAGPTTVGISPRLPPSVPELSPNLASLDIPTILMLVAGHMQLIQVYDALFGRAYISLRDMPPEFIATSLVFPALELGGYPVLQGHLQMKIIIQVVEYQLGQIERLIGFPAEYCLNGAQDSSQGILNNVDSSMLLQAIMSQIGARMVMWVFPIWLRSRAISRKCRSYSRGRGIKCYCIRYDLIMVNSWDHRESSSNLLYEDSCSS